MAYRTKNGVLAPRPKLTVHKPSSVHTHKTDRPKKKYNPLDNNVAPSQQNPTHFNYQKLKGLTTGKAPQICLVRKIGGLGDMLMMTPLAKAIKEQIPECHLTFAVDDRYANGQIVELLKHVPYIDETVAFEKALRSNYFDLMEDFTGICVKREVRGFNKNRIDMFAEHLGIDLEDKCTVYKTTIKEKEEAAKLIKTHISFSQNQKIIGIALRSQAIRRTWPLEKILEFAEMCHRQNICVLPLDAREDDARTLPSYMKVIPNLSFSQAAAVMEKLDLIVAVDSGLMHLAGALGAPTIALFGSVPPDSRINYYHSVEAITLPQRLPCQFCYYAYCNIREKCMKDIEAKAVFQRSLEILGGSPIKETTSSIPSGNFQSILL